MSDRGDDVRVTAEQLVADADRLRDIEAAKVKLPDDDPRVVALSAEAVALTEAMADTARIQLDIALDPEPA
jgi:hypothetical protein